MSDPSPEVDELAKVAVLIDNTMAGVARALIDGGMGKFEHGVTPVNGNTLAYCLGVKLPTLRTSQETAVAQLKDAFASIIAVIEHNCAHHVVRVAPDIRVERDFQMDEWWAAGCMRGTMARCGIGAGPAARSIPERDINLEMLP